MKYSEKSKFPKSIGLAGLYGLIACCLVLVGAISWVMVAKTKSNLKVKNSPSQSEAKDTLPSYYDNTFDDPKEPASENTNKDTSDVPYSSAPAPIADEQISYKKPVEGKISKIHSLDTLQPSLTYGDMRLHLGIDIVCSEHSEIKSIAKGTVEDITENALLGTTIIIKHSGGITAKYCGMDAVDVKIGDKVDIGTTLGTIGTVPSECEDKCHLHFETLRDGISISPQEVIEW